MTRAVTVRCRICGLEVTGAMDTQGVVRPSNRSRPEMDEPIQDGYCIEHAAAREAARALLAPAPPADHE